MDKKLFSKVSELSYPTSEISPQGRCNRKGKIMLYASTSELGTIVESVASVMALNILFTISSIKRKGEVNNKLVFKSFGIQEKLNIQGKYSKEFNDFCNQEFLKIIDKNSISENNYNFTIALNEFFSDGNIVTINANTKNKEPAYFNMALVYPCVYSKKITNKTVYNLAIKPEVFDINYKI